MDRGDHDERPQHVNRSDQLGPAELVQARDVHGGVHFHASGHPAGEPPRQLPADIRHFVNRRAELADLDGLLTGESLVVITGTAGVGKTALALRWAHRVRHRFPDGQLYLNLKGYDPAAPTPPEQALDRFLRALGVRPAEIPADADERAALLRSRLADRRMLLLLDNAASAGQVRPLLPGTAGPLVIVTSRDRLSGLVARDGGRRLTLGILPESDAIELLASVTVQYRADDTPEQFRELALLCARLPLALRIAAERAVGRPFMPLSELIQDLRDESGLWDALSTGDDTEAEAVRTVFAWSYRALPEAAARLFRLLGLHPTPVFGAAAAEALLGAGAGQRVRHLLDVLVGAHLLEQSGPDRFQLHDLLRAYAIDQVRHEETAADRATALRRLLSWYLHTADAALGALAPFSRTVVLSEPVDAAPPSFPGGAEADLWFATERENLVAATVLAGQSGMAEICWQLAAVLRGAYMHQNAFDDWLVTGSAGLAAARAIGDRYGEAEVLESLGKAHFQARGLTKAEEFHVAALNIRREIGNRFGEGVSTNALGLLGLRHRRLDAAADHFQKALDLFRSLDDRRWQALILGNLGETLYELARLDDAAEHLRQAIAVQEEIGDTAQEGNSRFFLSMALRELGMTAEALRSIESALAIAHAARNQVWLAHWLVEHARVLCALGRPADALDPLRRAAVIQRKVGDRSREAMALDCTGETYRDLGQPEEAVGFHLQAARTHRALNDPWNLALALTHLATALTDLGRTDDARPHLTEALTSLAPLSDPRATALETHLRAALTR
ncbi:tetratricopeptide repeat protein [Actinocorallia sp. API 0066]|uniref:ATP-binding protein n=1 Tax=Actinocorallia sp. API 0066 TaxID=2896846 RepID=UPI001E51FC72|nr:tetratricopeptide repeat protein [Actinocorallia sp. API 0066]MCD0447666.1 tetratricopeptide repeat protein [Actinocorallia sp. API 0066]